MTSTTLTPAVPKVVITPSSEIAKRNDAHSHRRRFIGPLPEELLSQVINVVESQPKRRGWFSSRRRQQDQPEEPSSSDSDSDSEYGEQGIRDAIREHAQQFFLGHGGRAEDWHEDTERHVREEMWRAWRDSQWGKLRAQRKEAARNANVKRWVGSSFDVGVFLGVDLLGRASSTSAAPSAARAPSTSTIPPVSLTERPGLGFAHVTPLTPITPSSYAGESFFTAYSQPESTAPPSEDTTDSNHETPLAGPSRHTTTTPPQVEPDSSASTPGAEHSSTPAQSDTALVSSPPPIQNAPSVAQSDSAALPKSPDAKQRKTVRYNLPDEESELVEESPPASPGEVLRRSGDEVQGTSAGAAQQATRENQVKWGDVVMRGQF